MSDELPKFSPLEPRLSEQLQLVEPSRDRSFSYYPCRVALRSGEILERVYVVEANSYLGLWGWDPGRSYVAIDEVTEIADSPHRLPKEFADELYAAGESGMGYTVFTLVMKDGSHLPFLTGDAVDFPNWPDGAKPEDVVGVIPHEGREAFRDRGSSNTSGASYLWCLYSSADGG